MVEYIDWSKRNNRACFREIKFEIGRDMAIVFYEFNLRTGARKYNSRIQKIARARQEEDKSKELDIDLTYSALGL